MLQNPTESVEAPIRVEHENDYRKRGALEHYLRSFYGDTILAMGQVNWKELEFLRRGDDQCLVPSGAH